MNIRTKIDYINESFSLLFSIGSGISLSEKIEKKISAEGASRDNFYQEQEYPLSVIFQIEMEMKKALQPSWDEFLFYFGKVDSEDFSDSLGRILMLWDEFKRDYLASFKEFKSQLLNMDDKEYQKAFSFTLQGIFDSLRDSTEFSDLDSDEDIIRNIITLNLPVDSQLKLEDFYLNRQDHLKKALVYVETAYKLLKKHDKELKTILDKFEDYYSLPLNFSQKPATDELDQDSCLNILKLISDPTRFEILSGITSGPAFGNEIAQRLSITTATVSHHMNLLIKANLVNIRQEGTRIYYESTPQTIKMCFDKIRLDFDL